MKKTPIKTAGAPAANAAPMRADQVRDALVLWLPPGWPESARPVAYFRVSGQRVVQRGTVERLSELPRELQTARVLVWTPAGETLLTEARLPTRSRAKILQALPYALEDQLLGEPANLHFVYRPKPDGSLAVAITASERIETWLGALQADGLTVEGLCPATLMAPIAAGEWSVVVDTYEVVVRSGEYSGFASALEPDLGVPAALQMALDEVRGGATPPDRLRVYAADHAIDVEGWSTALGLPIERVSLDATQLVLARPPLSLMDGRRAAGQGSRWGLGRYRTAAALFGLWLVVGLGFNLWEWWRLGRLDSDQRAQLTAVFKSSFPEARAVVDPALQMEQNLAILQAKSGRSAPGDMLPLLGRVAPALQSQPAAKLRSLQYAEGGLTIDIQLKDYQAMETFKNALGGQGLRVEVVTANQRGELIEARVRVKPEKRA